MTNFGNTVESVRKSGLYPPFRVIEDGVNEPTCVIEGKKYLLFCSNNYLSLTNNKKVKKAAINSVKKYGVGPGGSRVICGNVDIILDLEKAISDITGTEDCLSFPTGYMANVGVISAVMESALDMLAGQESSVGVIFSDELNHGSIVDGCRLTKAEKIIFKHNDLVDLEAKLKVQPNKKKLIITEGVFSLEGEILDLPSFVRLAKKYNALLMVDDAHGVGILGPHGGGVVDLHGLGSEVDIVMGCMDKAFGGTGGYICGNKGFIDYLKVSARSSLLSSAIPTVMAGAMLQACKIIKEGQALRSELFQKASYLRKKMIMSGLNILGKDEIPSIPFYIGKEDLGVRFEKSLFEEGIYLPIVRYPAADYNESRFRIIVMSSHSYSDLDSLHNACVKIAKELKLI